jgi:hypothetical protein
VKESSGSLREGDHAFQVFQQYPRGGDAIGLKAQNAKECKREFPLLFFHTEMALISSFLASEWIHDIDHAIRKCRHAEERAARKGLR